MLWRLRRPSWDLIATLGVEQRSLAVISDLVAMSRLGAATILRINDPQFAVPSPLASDTEARLRQRLQEYLALGGSESAIQDWDLLAYEQDIIDFGNTLVATVAPQVILDVSSMPKRYFFPLLALLHAATRIQDLLVAYTVPRTYARVLAENFEDVAPLPMFEPPANEPSNPLVVVSVGYELFRLPQLIAGINARPERIKVLLPIPSPAPGNRRNWETITAICRDIALSETSIVRVGNHDVSEAFDVVAALANGGSQYSILAPFGPKTLSVAMCLYATCMAEQGQFVPAYYTQPKVYNSAYSEGVDKRHGAPNIVVYALRLGGRNLYGVSGRYR